MAAWAPGRPETHAGASLGTRRVCMGEFEDWHYGRPSRVRRCRVRPGLDIAAWSEVVEGAVPTGSRHGCCLGCGPCAESTPSVGVSGADFNAPKVVRSWQSPGGHGLCGPACPGISNVYTADQGPE